MSQLIRTTQGNAQVTRPAQSSTPVTPRTPSSAPATPSAQKEQEATPGKWRHPKFDEIARRQYATTFDERNVRVIVTNGGLLAGTFIAPTVIDKVTLLRIISAPLFVLLHQVPYHADTWSLLLIRALLLYNVFRAFLPLARLYYPDSISDIPLTSSQRAAMGLKDVLREQTASSAYASPNYVTPPRYQKSTPRGSFSAQGDRASQSPQTGSPRAGMAKSTSNSPFYASTGSPFYQKAANGGSASNRKSFGGATPSGSLFGESGFSSSSGAPSTPTPSTGKASVGLNNKWLYEKRRDSPRSSLFSPAGFN